jgi:hypothetical protein
MHACQPAGRNLSAASGSRPSDQRPIGALAYVSALVTSARRASQRFRSLRSVCVTTRESKANDVTLRVADICTVASTTKVS